MTAWAADAVSRLQATFEPAADPERAASMTRYMRNQFAFLGLPAPERTRCQREALDGLGRPDEGALVAATEQLWSLEEREYQYAACDLVRRYGRDCSAAFLDHLRHLLTTKPWWDTVDELAAHGVGPLVAAHPSLVATMREWNAGEHLWLARTSILFQLGYGPRTDQDLLFELCLVRAGDTDFFIRKAIGWALRQHTRVAPDDVLSFLATHEAELSPLSRREAVKWLERRQARQAT